MLAWFCMIPYHNRLMIQRRQCTRLGPCLIALLLPACAVPSVPPAARAPGLSAVSGRHLQGTLVDVQTRQGIAFEALVQTVMRANVVAIGEEHYHPDIQAFALRLFQTLAQRRPQRLTLAMEFLERDGQQAVDAYLTGTIDQAAFQERLGASAAFMRYYFPLVQYARQSGLPVLAMNVPRRIARQVAREGLEKTLQHLDSNDLAYL